MSGPRKQVREWAQLRLLCQAGLPPISVARELLGVVRRIVPNAAGAMFLTSPQGLPHSFFHEDSPEAVRTLFQNEFAHFMGANEINVVQVVQQGGRGSLLLNPPSAYFRSNTYQLLVRASGHHHALDVRLMVDGLGAGAVMLFREPGAGFTPHEADCLGRVGRLLEFALASDSALASSASLGGPAWGHDPAAETAWVAVQPDGQPAWLTPEAEALLALLPQVGQAWRRGLPLPPALTGLVQALRMGCDRPELRLLIPGGSVQVRAQWLVSGAALAQAADHPTGTLAEDLARRMVGLTLKRERPAALATWRVLAAADLSPRQLEVAFALLTGPRDGLLAARLGISAAVLKDCTRAVYRSFDVAGLPELQQRVAAATH